MLREGSDISRAYWLPPLAAPYKPCQGINSWQHFLTEGLEKSLLWLTSNFYYAPDVLGRYFFYTLLRCSGCGNFSFTERGDAYSHAMKIGIADPHARVRFGLRILLEQQPEWTVIGEAKNCRELFQMVDNRYPDLVLIDWDLPGLPADKIIGLVRRTYPRLLIISMSGRQEDCQAALMNGADAFACKTESPLILISTIKEVSISKLVD